VTPNWNVVYPYYCSLAMHPDGNFFSCAIRLSMALHRGGAFNKVGYKKRGYAVSKHGWAMVAEQLYQWLRLQELGEAQQIAVSAADMSHVPQVNGIVYLRDCFLRSTDKAGATGDHIDLFVAGKGMLSAVRWPTEFPDGAFGLLGSCRDGKIRFWPTT
jgi:hypothetical protein